MASSCVRPAADKIVVKPRQPHDVFAVAELPAQAPGSRCPVRTACRRAASSRIMLWIQKKEDPRLPRVTGVT